MYFLAFFYNRATEKIVDFSIKSKVSKVIMRNVRIYISPQNMNINVFYHHHKV